MRDIIYRQDAIDTDGLDEEIRCEMCKNPMHTDRGCDGNCKYDEILYEKIIQILDKRITPLPLAQPEQCKDAVSKAKVLEAYADLYDVFDDNKGIQHELHKVFDRINNLPSAQPEQSESEDIIFWEKRAREYEEMVLKLIDEMARSIKINSVLITEEGIVFKKEKPEQRWIPCKTALPEKGQYVLCQCRAGIMDVLRLTDDNGWYKDSTHIYMHGFVLAWCKLPEPWKEGEAE